jgi:hypothetical protein
VRAHLPEIQLRAGEIDLVEKGAPPTRLRYGPDERATITSSADGADIRVGGVDFHIAALRQDRTVKSTATLTGGDGGGDYDTSVPRAEGDPDPLVQLAYSLNASDPFDRPPPGVTVALNYFFCGDELPKVDNLRITAENLRFCFTHVYVVIDVPHGGKYYPLVPIHGGPGDHDRFVRSEDGHKLIEKAEQVSNEVAALLTDACGHPVAASVEVMNYDSPELRNEALDDFAADVGTPTWRETGGTSNPWPFRDMWRNTMPYNALTRRSGADYVFHADSQFRVLETPGRKFIPTALELVRSDERVAMVAPGMCDSSAEVRPMTAFQGRWQEASDLVIHPASDVASVVSLQVMLMDVRKIRACYPTPAYTTSLEHGWSVMLNAYSKYFVYTRADQVQCASDKYDEVQHSYIQTGRLR